MRTGRVTGEEPSRERGDFSRDALSVSERAGRIRPSDAWSPSMTEIKHRYSWGFPSAEGISGLFQGRFPHSEG